jgi:hypothetical protein
LGIAAQGGNYRVIKKAIEKYDIDCSHFTGQAWSKGQNIGPKRPIKDYLIDGSTIKSYSLKKRLLREKMLEPVCQMCFNDEWLNGPIPLELDHINGKSDDNRFENLRLLCPNCHALTPTYRRPKNIWYKKAD